MLSSMLLGLGSVYALQAVFQRRRSSCGGAAGGRRNTPPRIVTVSPIDRHDPPRAEGARRRREGLRKMSRRQRGLPLTPRKPSRGRERGPAAAPLVLAQRNFTSPETQSCTRILLRVLHPAPRQHEEPAAPTPESPATAARPKPKARPSRPRKNPPRSRVAAWNEKRPVGSAPGPHRASRRGRGQTGRQLRNS